MNALKKAPPLKAENLFPARLADQQLDHLERMIGSIVKNNPATPALVLDPEYWESRVRALVQQNNLLVVQQQRVRRLLAKLQQRAKNNTMDRTAA
jgi:3-methyladenine DNA glycosylase/8-oxoguanine DNA glycosylase